MKTGDKVLFIGLPCQVSALRNFVGHKLDNNLVEVENNPFVGIVISAETEDKNVFFGQEDLFKPKNTSVEIELPFYVFNILERQAKKEGITLKEYICKELEEYCKQSV